MASSIQSETDCSWITPRRFALFLAMLILVSWPGILFGLRMFVFRDFGFFAAPIAWHLRESLLRLDVPLWNPLNNCGQPFLAEWNTQALYPPALLYVLLPFPWSLGVFCLLHLFLGGLGMFLLARDWTRNSFAAAVAGVIFAFSGLVAGSLLWPSIISALGWMPWLVWLTRRAWREGGQALPLAAIVGGLQMLTGGAEVILLTWVLAGAFAVTDFCSLTTSRAKIALRFCAAVFLVAGLSAVQLLPFFDLLRHSDRAGHYFASDSPMPPTGWVNFLVPLFRDKSVQGIFFQDGQYWILSYYTGVITVALAAIAVALHRRVEVWLLAILTVFFLVLAAGNATPLYPWLASHAAIISVIRFPVKFLILPVFALPLMAAYALAGDSAITQDVRRFSLYWLVPWLVTCGLISGCLVWAAHEPLLNQTHAVVVNGLARIAFFTAIIIVLFVLQRTPPARLRSWLQLLALVLVWLDLASHAPQPPMVNPAVFKPNMTRPTPPPRAGLSRAMIPPDVLKTLTFAAHPDATENFLSDRFAMFSDCNLFDDIPKCDGFYPLNLKQDALLDDNLNRPMQEFLGVSEALTIRSGVLDWTPQTRAMPLLTGGQKPFFAPDAQTVDRLADTNFNPRTEVYLPLEARNKVTVSNTAPVRVLAAKYSPEMIQAEVNAGTPAMLVAAQTYYHPWRAYVDGAPTPLWRANDAFQALEIPAGTHAVKLIYVDWNFRIGLLVTATTFALALALIITERARKI